jgi:hypothetical protein
VNSVERGTVLCPRSSSAGLARFASISGVGGLGEFDRVSIRVSHTEPGP